MVHCGAFACCTLTTREEIDATDQCVPPMLLKCGQWTGLPTTKRREPIVLCRAFVARRQGNLGHVVRFALNKFASRPSFARNRAACSNTSFAELSGAYPTIVGQTPRGVFSVLPLFSIICVLLELPVPLELEPAAQTPSRRGAVRCGVAQRPIRPSPSRPSSAAIANSSRALFNGSL